MRKRLLFTLLIIGALASARVIAAQRDSATIQNSGSTNTAGFRITLWSDGPGSVQFRGVDTARKIAIAPDLAARFFNDLHAAKDENAPPQHCMKSASFGTTTTVIWQGWTSPDLQCPPAGPNIQALAQDVKAIEAAAGVGPGPLHRIGLPPSVRKNPPATPEAEAT